MKLHSNRAAADVAHGTVPNDPVAATLVETGDLSPESLRRIEDYRERTGASFVDAAVELGLITPEDASRAMTVHAPSSLIDPETSGINRAVVAAYDPEDPLVVKLRALRSALFNADDLGRGPTRILVLTGIRTEDSVGIAANLAVLVAQLGMRGVLVDANFPGPAQHALFGVNSDLGVTSLLAGNGQVDASVVETAIPNLDLLPAGPQITSLNEVAERVSLVAQLRASSRHYAFAIIDAGEQPAEMISALARGADGVVMVVERNHTPLSSLRSLLAALDRNDVPVLGSVLAR